jgi:flagellar hook-associated protein 2
MAITAAGVGSGLDIEGIVSQLMSLERQPLVALQKKTSDTKAQISSYGTLKSAMSSFQDAMKDLGTLDAFRKFATSSSDEDVMTATADADGAAGIYNIDVTRLAQNHKLGSNEFLDTDTIGGTGGDSITLTVGTDSAVIDLSGGMTLSVIRDAINSASDNPGVTATILNTGGGNQRLILTAEESGYDNRMQMAFGGSVGTALGLTMTNRDSLGAVLTDLTHLDASYSIDGFALTASSNKVTDALDGLSLELKGVGSSVLAVNRDDESIKESAKAFVDAYNEVLNKISELSDGELSGDPTLRGIVRSMRNTLNTAPVGLTGSFNALSQMGIKTNADTGLLEFNESDFGEALDTDFASVAQVFANDNQGYAFRFEALADRLLDLEGPLDSRVDTLNDRIRRFGRDEERMEFRLERKEAALRRQYSALDSLVGSLQSTSNFLLQNFSV